MSDAVASIEQMVLAARERGPVVLLESQDQKHPAGNISYLATDPAVTISSRDGVTTISDVRSGTHRQFTTNPWSVLANHYRKHPDWYFGYFGYDLKNHIEALTSANYDPLQAPDLFLMVPTQLYRINHGSGQITALRKSVRTGLQGGTSSIPPFQLNETPEGISAQEYVVQVQKAKDWIREGDFYEINYSHQLKAGCDGDAYDLYRKMRSHGPVPFGGYLWLPDDGLHVCSASPERFVARKGSRIWSQPIKGTARRDPEPEEDRAIAQELAQSVKNRAENLMIVDLVRHDFNKIAQKGSVRVPKLFEIQSFPSVHQMVSTVEAEVVDQDPIAIIKACFPMGSMTGAPKVRAMQRIEALETYRRGIYSGAMGYVSPTGDFDLNVVIRTAIVKQNRLYYAAGGAITSDSDPKSEWEETYLKSEALRGALNQIDNH